MRGTEGTEYLVVLQTSLGRVGYRELGGLYRVRLEPTEAGAASISRILTAATGWKQPTKDQKRYSKVVPSEELGNVVEFTTRTLDQGGARPEVNPLVSSEIHEIAARAQMRRAIFISYRRSESQCEVERVYEGLKRTFLATPIFRDVHSIPLGAPFPAKLQDALNSTGLGLVVIGPQWVATLQRRASSKLVESTDFVQFEVEQLLSANIPVIPCLVSRAIMPLASELPESVRPLLKRQGIALRPDPDFHHDMERLFEKLPPYAS